jgi:hypothetical protein
MGWYRWSKVPPLAQKFSVDWPNEWQIRIPHETILQPRRSQVQAHWKWHQLLPSSEQKQVNAEEGFNARLLRGLYVLGCGKYSRKYKGFLIFFPVKSDTTEWRYCECHDTTIIYLAALLHHYLNCLRMWDSILILLRYEFKWKITPKWISKPSTSSKGWPTPNSKYPSFHLVRGLTSQTDSDRLFQCRRSLQSNRPSSQRTHRTARHH